MSLATLDTLPASVDDHPRVAELLATVESHRLQAELVRTTRDTLRRERESLDTAAATALVSLGKLTPGDLDARRRELDHTLSEADADLAKRTMALDALATDLRGVRDAARREILAAAVERARELFGRMGEAFAEAERLAVDIEDLRVRYGMQNLPRKHVAAIHFAQEWRAEARRFGVAI